MDFLGNEYLTLILIPILVGVLKVISSTEIINIKFIPLVSIFLGMLLGIFFTGFEMKDGIISGIYIGLSAVGLFSGTVNVIEGIKARE